jgi:hypothetical protein
MALHHYQFRMIAIGMHNAQMDLFCQQFTASFAALAMTTRAIRLSFGAGKVCSLQSVDGTKATNERITAGAKLAPPEFAHHFVIDGCVCDGCSSQNSSNHTGLVSRDVPPTTQVERLSTPEDNHQAGG